MRLTTCRTVAPRYACPRLLSAKTDPSARIEPLCCETSPILVHNNGRRDKYSMAIPETCNRISRPHWLLALVGICLTFAISCLPDAVQTNPNVLFIAVDDLNHWVGHLGGQPNSLTPNIDRLAARGVSFNRAYCSAPLCNPSRVSLMTGITPARSGVYGNMEKLRTHLPDAVTLPQYFRDHGYIAKGGGKIYHSRGAYDEASWDQYFSASSAKRPKTPRPKDAPHDMWVNWGPTPLEDADMFDAQIADQVIAELGKTHDKPFFIAYGLTKPHMPWVVSGKVLRAPPRRFHLSAIGDR